MCGIVGYIDAVRPVDATSFASAVDSLASRGPDGRGEKYLAEGRVALGHRRLAIVDLSHASDQPICNEDESKWLVFNGEIFNHLELRRKLQRAGHRFKSVGDSEVIVHAYEEWGDACVEKFNGIFAFAIWDVSTRRLFMARDHLGVKPLYYSASDSGIRFASQPKALLNIHEGDRAIDGDAFREYLAFGYVSSCNSIYQGISRLGPGERLVYQEGRVEVDRYWRAEYRPLIHDADDAFKLLDAQLKKSVSRQLMADVPVGLFLSGGIDSSAIAGLMANCGSEAFSSFTMGFSPGEDERGFARIVAESHGFLHHDAVMALDDVAAHVSSFIEIYDEPFVDSSGLPMLCVSELARSHDIKVVLGGDGGDELFVGYARYDEINRRSNRKRGLRGRIVESLGRGKNGAEEYFRWVGFLDGCDQEQLLGPAGKAISSGKAIECLRSAYNPSLPAVVAAQLADLETYLPGDILAKVDRASMCHGVEVRVPLLDVELVELIFQIDVALNFPEGQRKGLFRKVVSSYIPAEINTGRKKGFSVPLKSWMEAGLRKYTERMLMDGSLVSSGWLDPKGVMKVLAKKNIDLEWLLLSAELWSRRWIEGESASDLAEGLRRSLLPAA
jgi:asparagine synthase (glutamine-hydrolysing)